MESLLYSGFAASHLPICVFISGDSDYNIRNSINRVKRLERENGRILLQHNRNFCKEHVTLTLDGA
jgi:hypothetical protein